MKRKKIKNYLKLGILFIAILLVFSNCEDESDFGNNTSNNSIYRNNAQINTLNFSEFDKLNLKLSNISEKFDFNKTLYKNSISTKITTNNFTILTDKIIQVQTDNTETYAFIIETPTDENSEFENFVIDVLNNGTYKYYIIKYIFDGKSNSDFPYIISKIALNNDIVDINELNIFEKVQKIGDCYWDIQYNEDGDAVLMWFIGCDSPGSGGVNNGDDMYDAADDIDGSGNENGGSVGHSNNNNDTANDNNGTSIDISPIGINKPNKTNNCDFFNDLANDQSMKNIINALKMQMVHIQQYKVL